MLHIDEMIKQDHLLFQINILDHQQDNQIENTMFHGHLLEIIFIKEGFIYNDNVTDVSMMPYVIIYSMYDKHKNIRK
jgi:hypothetical protein